jgi:uncharacterized protein YoaH (UPF0181 family)
MGMNLIKQIMAKAMTLPLEQQQKALNYIESLAAEQAHDEQIHRLFAACMESSHARLIIWKKIWLKSGARCGRTFHVRSRSEFCRG